MFLSTEHKKSILEPVPVIISLYVIMDSSFWFDAMSLGWSIIYIEGSQGMISK